MKIRTDFVTNSSSSSFVCIQFKSKKLKELLQKDYKIVDAPPPVGKDVNDFLMSYLGLSRQKPVRERSDVR